MVYSIKVECLKNNLKKVRDFITTILEKSLLPPHEINLMVLAVDELCANLIIHSHQCNPQDCIEITIINKDPEFIFEIRDYSAEYFNITEYNLPDIQQLIKEKKNGGIGLILVNKIADKIYFERQGSENVCRISKIFDQSRLA